MSGWIDALPYIDTQYGEPGMKDVVNKLIKEEMKRFAPSKDYLAHLPMPELKFAESVFMETEMKRMAAGEEMGQMDITRYSLGRPEGTKSNSIDAWRDAVGNAKAQLEHQQLRLTNLELLHKFGPNAWLEQNKDVRQMKDSVAAELASSKKEITAINRKRKTSQVAVGPELHSLEREFIELCGRNVATTAACHQLEEKLKRARTTGPEGGEDAPAQ